MRHQPPAVVRARSDAAGDPWQTYVIDGPVCHLAASPGNLSEVYSMDGNLRLVKSANPATAVTDVMFTETDLSVIVSGGTMCGVVRSLTKYGRQVSLIGSRLVIASSKYGTRIRATLSTTSCTSGALLESVSDGLTNLNATG